MTNERTTHLMQAIQDRRSFALQQLSPDPINLADIELMLDAANWAPQPRADRTLALQRVFW